ncbi:hypothetical protein M4578_15790 [Salipiger sp. P9]|nr:hypothetical protein [Salipiger pentaromativorans]
MTPNALVPKRASRRLGVVALLILLAGTLGFQEVEVLQLDYSTLAQQLVVALGSALAIALLLERAVEVLLQVICGPQEAEIRARQAVMRQSQEDAMAREKAVFDMLETTDERMTFLSAGGSAERLSALAMGDSRSIETRTEQAAALTIQKQYLSTICLTVLGGAIAMGGYRLLAPVLQLPDPNTLPGMQHALLTLLDVVVTTLVLGGGAKGIHDMITRLTEPGDG